MKMAATSPDYSSPDGLLHNMPDFPFHDHLSQEEVGRDHVIATIEHSKIKKCGCPLNERLYE